MRDLAIQQHQRTSMRHASQWQQKRSPRSASSMSRRQSPRSEDTSIRPKFVALAPGRDAVLKYQERQYRRNQQEQIRQYTGHKEALQTQQRRVRKNKDGYDVNLTGNRMSLGSRIESARTWANGRRPEYY
jgi:hypothetical protein